MNLTGTPARAAALGVCALLAVAVVATGVTLAAQPSAPASAAAATLTPQSGPAPGITVSGSGTVSGTPDALRVNLGVSTTGGTVSEALTSANTAADRVQKSLLRSGVKPADLQTSGLSIQPNYDRKGQPSGYAVTESVAATVHGVGRVGGTLSAAVKAGGNAVRLDGMSLDLTDSSTLLTAARDRAFADARHKADQYAKAAGRSLGAVVSVTEAVAQPSPFEDKSAAAGAGRADSLSSVPIQAGSQDVKVDVTVVFGLG